LEGSAAPVSLEVNSGTLEGSAAPVSLVAPVTIERENRCIK